MGPSAKSLGTFTPFSSPATYRAYISFQENRETFINAAVFSTGVLGPVTLDVFGDIEVTFTVLYTTVDTNEVSN